MVVRVVVVLRWVVGIRCGAVGDHGVDVNNTLDVGVYHTLDVDVSSTIDVKAGLENHQPWTQPEW